EAPAPLFSAFLNYRYSGAADAPNDLGRERRRAWEGIGFLAGETRSNYPISLDVDDQGDGFVLSAQVEAPTVPDRVCAYMHTALEQLVEALEAAPTTPLRDLEVLPESERYQLLTEWNETRRFYSTGARVHQLFERQAKNRAEAIAVIDEAQQLSYGEL